MHFFKLRFRVRPVGKESSDGDDQERDKGQLYSGLVTSL